MSSFIPEPPAILSTSNIYTNLQINRSQFLYRLNEANIFTVTPDIYLNFNTNYGPGTSTRAGGVGYAAFNDTYHAKHVAIAGVRYLGNREYFLPFFSPILGMI